MPSMKRKRPSGVSSVYKKQKTAGEAALTAVKSLKRRIAAATELKAEDVNTVVGTPLTMTTVATNISHLTQVAGGSGIVQRVGQQIQGKSLNLRYNIKEAGATGGMATARVVVVQWKKQASSTAPSLARLLEATTNAAMSQYSFTNQFKENFNLLHDATYALGGGGGSGASVFRMVNIPLNFKISYSGSAAADIEKNGIYMYLISDIAVGANPPTISFSSTLYFTDD